MSEAALEHWVPIEAILAYETLPQRPVPRGVVPDPPTYIACIAYLQIKRPKAVAPSALATAPQLKDRCRQYNQSVRQHALQFLISYAWVVSEARALGITVTDREVQQHWAQLKSRRFPSEAIFQNYLKYTRSTLADQLLHLRFNLIAEKFGKRVLAEGGLPRARQFYSAFPKRWAPRTDCRPGYIIPECKQYKGPEPPEVSV